MEICVLASGSSGNCVYIATDQARVLVDAGISTRRIEVCLRAMGVAPSELDAVVITHEHSDHVAGIGALARRHRVPIYATELTWRGIGNNIGELPHGTARPFPGSLEIKDLWIESFATLHDAADPVGYTFNDGQVKVGLMTDTGAVPEAALTKLAGAQALVFETNHDVEMLTKGNYPVWLKRRILGDRGHLSNVAAAAALVKLLETRGAGAARVFLAHLSKENNRPDLAYTAVEEALTQAGMKTGDDVDLVMTHRDRMGELYKVG